MGTPFRAAQPREHHNLEISAPKRSSNAQICAESLLSEISYCWSEFLALSRTLLSNQTRIFVTKRGMKSAYFVDVSLDGRNLWMVLSKLRKWAENLKKTPAPGADQVIFP